LAEASAFVYVGLTFFTISTYALASWQFCLVELIIIIIGRFLGNIISLYPLVLLGHKPRISFKELCFVSYAGLVRGSVALGLLQEMSNSELSYESSNIIPTTVFAMVSFSTMVFGFFMPMAAKLLAPFKHGHESKLENEPKLLKTSMAE
jgi:NhaP-type Na+/H+ or K+/H+ antiporter